MDERRYRFRVPRLGDDIFSLFITNNDVHPRIGGSYGDWQDSGLFQKRTYGNDRSPNIGFRASGLGDGSLVWYGNVTGETVSGRGGCYLHGGMFAMETDDNRITSAALHRGFRASGLGDDRFYMQYSSSHDTVGGRGFGYSGSEFSGIFFIDTNNPRTMSNDMVGFRALVMINVITSHLVPNVSDWVRVDVTC